MCIRDRIGGYQIENTQESIPLWEETKIILHRVYKSHGLTGEIYSVENVTKKTVTLHEREFMNFQGRTQAVALEKLSLAPSDKAFLYIIREGDL